MRKFVETGSFCLIWWLLGCSLHFTPLQLQLFHRRCRWYRQWVVSGVLLPVMNSCRCRCYLLSLSMTTINIKLLISPRIFVGTGPCPSGIVLTGLLETDLWKKAWSWKSRGRHPLRMGFGKILNTDSKTDAEQQFLTSDFLNRMLGWINVLVHGVLVGNVQALVLFLGWSCWRKRNLKWLSSHER